MTGGKAKRRGEQNKCLCITYLENKGLRQIFGSMTACSKSEGVCLGKGVYRQPMLGASVISSHVCSGSFDK